MVQQYKLDKVKELAKLIDDYKVVGLLELSKLPAAHMHSIKQDTRDISKVVVAKKRLIKRAFDASGKKGVSELLDLPVAIPALIFSNENPFKLFATLKKSKAEAFAKEGDKAPRDIIVPEGETSLPPGPIIGALQKANIRARIQGDKIVISEDSKAVSEGDVINADLSSILMQLGIKPMEIGLNIAAVFEDGVVFDRKTLDIDVDSYVSDIASAHAGAFNLAINAGIITEGTLPVLIGKAHMEALNLAVNAGVTNSKTILMFISKAQLQMNAVASVLPDDARGGMAVVKQEAVQAAGDGDGDKAEPVKKEEEKKPEDMAAGLGSLFG
ncbi:MAG: 50S ribosomal protein L10, partial [Candidatus Aenigmarchaeota archaeon]|nr:50S ribosomal protein L10 [Candidatus Aenigmarchaeota archaeon]